MSRRTKSAEDLERDAETEGSRFAETAGALRDKVSVGAMTDAVLDAGSRVGHAVGRTVRRHPIPLALMSLGLVWLIASRSADADREREAEEDEAHGGLRGLADEAGEKASELGHEAVEAGGRLARRARSGAGRLLEDQPLVVGALAFAVGAAIGGALLNSRAENRLMGDKAARLRRKVKETVSEEGRKVSDVAEAAAEEAKRIVEDYAKSLDRSTPEGRALAEKLEAEAAAAARRIAEAAEREARRVHLGETGKKEPTEGET